MNVRQLVWKTDSGWEPSGPSDNGISPQLILAFWSVETESVTEPLSDLKASYPNASIMGCSTSGEIIGVEVHDGTFSATLVEFESATVKGAKVRVADHADSMQVGAKLAESLPFSGLRHVLVLSDGLQVNGSDLAKGLINTLPDTVSITGGLAGDGDRFQSTAVVLGDVPEEGVVAAVGLYGDSLHIGYGSKGGWDAFGPERLITHSEGNVLYEMDGESALKIYESYLGKHAEELPAAGLLFPLSIRKEGSGRSLVRTILAIDRDKQTMTFAGDVPQGAYAQFMMANFDRLVDGAIDAAEAARIGESKPGLALLISCVGRKLILKQMVEDEVEGVQDVVGEQAVLTGFYSYGELAPFEKGGPCDLHNQTMTITTIDED